MEAIIRGVAVYLIIFIIFRIAGKRSLAEITTFDFLLLLIIGEAVQEAMMDNDYSFTNATLVIITLVGMDIGISLLTERSEWFSKFVDSVPILLIQDGKLHKDRMAKVRVDESDILQYAREHHGIERLDQIKYAILERSGGITIVPKAESQERNQKKK